MEPQFISDATDKAERYRQFISYFKLLISGEDELISTMANTTATLHDAFGFLWVGFYIVKGEDLILGPFQGSPACTRIRRGCGVCGTAWEEKRSIIVPDVDLFPGHIACSSLSRSEIVIPIISSEGLVTAVLDIDSDRPDNFDEVDRHYLEAIIDIIARTVMQ